MHLLFTHVTHSAKGMQQQYVTTRLRLHPSEHALQNSRQFGPRKRCQVPFKTVCSPLVMAAVHAAAAAAADTNATAQRLSTVARGFVGQATPLASDYYSKDYDWHEHAAATAPLLAAQWAGAPAAVQQAAVMNDASGLPLSAVAAFLRQQQSNSSTALQQGLGIPVNSISPVKCRDADEPRDADTAAAAHDTRTSGGLSGDSSSSSSDNEWEQFYRAHPAAKFFKERRYLLLEFPCLSPPSCPGHVVEIGAGCGSSILPVLRAQPQARATLSDISSTCLQQLLQAMQHLGLDTQRVEAFTADGTSSALAQRLAGCAADVALIMFTLSAVMPEGMLGMMRNAAAALRPGGLLCIRDHALYDMVSSDRHHVCLRACAGLRATRWRQAHEMSAAETLWLTAAACTAQQHVASLLAAAVVMVFVCCCCCCCDHSAGAAAYTS